jgi:hypothetical protein
MTSLGYDRPLYILPFDHRGSFQKKMFGWDGTNDLAKRMRGRVQITTDALRTYLNHRRCLRVGSRFRAASQGLSRSAGK